MKSLRIVAILFLFALTAQSMSEESASDMQTELEDEEIDFRRRLAIEVRKPNFMFAIKMPEGKSYEWLVFQYCAVARGDFTTKHDVQN